MDDIDAEMGALRESRGDLIAEAITEAFGDRCSEDQPGCPKCDAWAQYDALRSKAGI